MGRITPRWAIRPIFLVAPATWWQFAVVTQPPYPDDADRASAARAAIGTRIGDKLRRNPMTAPIANDRMEIFVRHGFLTPTECTAMMEKIDADSIPSKLFSGREQDGFRTSSSCNLPPDDPLVIKLSARIDALTGFATELGETIQGQRYAQAQEYKSHRDYFPGNVRYWPDMRDAGGQRCWTAMIYLNAVEEGGETQFVSAGFTVPPRPGTLLVWNNMRADGSPNVDTLHAALPVVRGVKYVLTRWYRERPWFAVPIT